MRKLLLRHSFNLILLFFTIAVQGQSPLPQDSATIFVDGSTELYTKVDSVPRFPGGQKAWMKFLIKTLRYPAEAQDEEIVGETRVSFIVDVDGTISDIRPVMGDRILAKESVRIIELSGKWEPAIYQQRKVRAYHIQPIKYMLEFERGARRKNKRS